MGTHSAFISRTSSHANANKRDISLAQGTDFRRSVAESFVFLEYISVLIFES